MPQMSPLNWLLVSFSSVTILIFCMIIFFFLMPKLPSTNISSFKSTNKTPNMKW